MNPDRTGVLLAAARAAGLELVPDRLEIDDSGADFVVAHAVDTRGTAWIVRVPRRPDVLSRAHAERDALRWLRPRLPVEVPQWRHFSPDLIAYPRLSGDPAALIDAAAGGYVWRFDAVSPPRSFVESLGATLAALHAIPVQDAVAAGLRVRSPVRIREELAEQMGRAVEILSVPERTRDRWRRWLTDDSYWPARSVPVHGDLHPAHILVDDANRVSGLLDWTETHVADPAMDFTLQFAAMGERALDALLEAYDAAGGTIWPRMRAHIVESWVAYPITVASFALITGEEAHRQFAQQLVDSGGLGESG